MINCILKIVIHFDKDLELFDSYVGRNVGKWNRIWLHGFYYNTDTTDTDSDSGADMDPKFCKDLECEYNKYKDIVTPENRIYGFNSHYAPSHIFIAKEPVESNKMINDSNSNSDSCSELEFELVDHVDDEEIKCE